MTQPDDKVPTLGDIADALNRMKDLAVTRASIMYALDRVFWEDHRDNPEPEHGAIAVIITDGFRPVFDTWLENCELELFSIPVVDTLPMFGVRAQ